MKIKKKILAALTAIAMFASATPYAVFAADTGANYVAEPTADDAAEVLEDEVYISEDGEKTEESEYLDEEETAAIELLDTAEYVAPLSEQTDDSVAVVYTDDVSDGSYYSDFDSIYNDISGGTITDGMTIKLINDATWTLTAAKYITIGLTFDLNGHTFMLDGSYIIQFQPANSSSKVAFIDSSYTDTTGEEELKGKVIGSYNITSYNKSSSF